MHEATRTGGVGGEVAAVVAEAAFGRLGGPIVRVTGLDAPVPFAAPPEDAFLKKAEFREARGTPLTFLRVLVKATAHLLPEFPTLNARWSEEGSTCADTPFSNIGDVVD